MKLIDSYVFSLWRHAKRAILINKTSGVCWIYEILIIIPALDEYPHSNNTRSWRPCKKIIPAGLIWGNTVVWYECWQKVDVFGPPTYLPRLLNVVWEQPLKSRSQKLVDTRLTLRSHYYQINNSVTEPVAFLVEVSNMCYIYIP